MPKLSLSMQSIFIKCYHLSDFGANLPFLGQFPLKIKIFVMVPNVHCLRFWSTVAKHQDQEQPGEKGAYLPYRLWYH